MFTQLEVIVEEKQVVGSGKKQKQSCVCSVANQLIVLPGMQR